jgi:predicted nucleic acid-binding protein
LSTAMLPLVDTDIWIDFLRGTPQAVTFVSKLPNEVAISSISVAELYAGVRDGAETQALSDLLDTLEVIDLNRDIAQAGGLIRREHGKAHGVGLNDALIAATALNRKACLYTLNLKHYPSMRKNQVMQPYRKS